MTVRRGTTNRNDRGSAESRRIRRQWLLDNFGDGTTCLLDVPDHPDRRDAHR